ncbi:hypothetical protein BH09SUM1_BH09SUM1_02070 [soil metagenome]
MKRLKSAATAGLLTSFILAAGLANAQKLAVPGKSPANPVTILSIPDSSAAWTGFAGSPLGRAFIDFYGNAAMAQTADGKAFRDQVATAEKVLGISLKPADLMTQTLSGMDLYVVDDHGASRFALVMAFNDPALPGKILDQLKKDAKSSSGVSGGFTADTVVEKPIADGRSLYMPAFELYFAQQGNTLVYSASRDVLESTISNGGEPLFTSEYYTKFTDGIKDEPNDVWMFGEIGRLATLAGAAMPMQEQNAFALFTKTTAAGAVSLKKDHIKVTTFVPVDEMKTIDKRYAMAAPPAGEIPILNYFPKDVLFAYGTNHFDGLAILDSWVDDVSGMPGMENAKQAVDQRLDESSQQLGFDPKNDFLANMGPDLGFVITKFEASGDASWMPKSAGIAFACHIKDPDRFAQVLRTLQEWVAPPPPMTADQKGPAPKSLVTSEEVDGQTILSVAVPPLAWTLTADNMFIVSMDSKTVADTMAQAKSTSSSITASSVYTRSGEFMDKNRNSYSIISLAQLADTLGAMAPAPAADDPNAAAMAKERDAFLNVLKSASTVATTSVFRKEGKKQETVVLMK